LCAAGGGAGPGRSVRGGVCGVSQHGALLGAAVEGVSGGGEIKGNFYEPRNARNKVLSVSFCCLLAALRPDCNVLIQALFLVEAVDSA